MNSVLYGKIRVHSSSETVKLQKPVWPICESHRAGLDSQQVRFLNADGSRFLRERERGREGERERERESDPARASCHEAHKLARKKSRNWNAMKPPVNLSAFTWRLRRVDLRSMFRNVASANLPTAGLERGTGE